MLQTPSPSRGVFPWHLDVGRLSVYDSSNDASDNGLFQLSGETSCLFTTSI